MQPAIIYLREVSGESLQEQLETCRRFAAAKGFEAVATVMDLKTSGPAYRLGQRGMLDMVGAGDVEVVIALSQEQVSKDPVRLASLQEMLGEKNCTLYFAQDTAGS